MNEGQARRVAEIFAQALELPAAEQAPFITAASEGDSAVAAEVASLLDADSRAAASPPTTERNPPPRPAAAQRRIGPYRLVAKLGEGGMSEVFLGLRDDGEIDRRVAVKLVRRELLSPAMQRRFETERQILAALDHPAIARLFDAGHTAEGEPYFVLEHIDGEPIDAYCDRQRLAVRERIELFQRVARGVHAAHQNLVVHRDLKPSNILVTSKGEPKLVDFGIAKLLNPELAGRGLEPTRRWERLLTPAYASPEQLLGQPITTASDVYSLGVLLYRLLTGALPFDLAERSLAEAEKLVTSTDPPRASTRVSGDGAEGTAALRQTQPRGLARELAGDLDAILDRALRKEPAGRYPSAESFAADLDRHLAGLPVEARRGGLRYRAGRFVRRNRLAVASATLVALALLGAAIGFASLSAELRAERNLARAERDRAGQIAGFLQRLFATGEPNASRGHELTVREMLARASAQLASELAAQPARRAELLLTLGSVYYSLGEFREAAARFDEALAAFRGLPHADPDRLAEALAWRGDTGRLLGELDAAERDLQQALDLLAARHGPDGEPVAGVLLKLGRVRAMRGEPAEAEALERRALGILEAQDLPNRLLTAEVLVALGTSLGEQARLAEAEVVSRRAIALQREVLGSESTELIDGLTSLGATLAALRRFSEAEPLLLEADRLEARLRGEANPTRYQNFNNLAALASQQKDYAKAERYYRRALALAAPTLEARHPHRYFLLNGLGISLTELGRFAEAEPLLREALAIRRQTVPAGSWDLAWAEVGLARCLLGERRFAEAEALLLRAYPPIAEQRPVGDSKRRITLEKLVALYETWGRPAQAEPYRRLLGENS